MSAGNEGMSVYAASEAGQAAGATFRNELLTEVTDTLTWSGVDYGVYSGSHAALLAGHRPVKDIDIWFDYAKIDDVHNVFPEATMTDRRQSGENVTGDYDGALFSFGDAAGIELMTGTFTRAEGVKYPLCWDNELLKRLELREYSGVRAHFVNPVDTLLFKAISQRPPEEGKHDLADIAAIAGAVAIDKAYLFWRTTKSLAWGRVMPLLIKMDIVTIDDINEYRASGQYGT